MLLSRQFALTTCTLAIAMLTGCGSIADPIVSLDLRLTRVAPAGTGGLLIEYDLTNTGTQAAAVTSCGGGIMPVVRVEMPNGTRDSWSLICIAILNWYDVTLAPGSSQHRSVVVGQRAGAQYEVTMPYHLVGEKADARWTAPRTFRWP